MNPAVDSKIKETPCVAGRTLRRLSHEPAVKVAGRGCPHQRYISDMAKCPYCKQIVTLDKTNRESQDVSDAQEVHKDVAGLVKKEIMYSCPHCDSVLGFGFFIGGLFTGRP